MKKKKRMTEEHCDICFDIHTFQKQAVSKALFQKRTTDEIECPPDAKGLGRATWTFLHTMAAYYPIEPSRERQKDMWDFLSAFSKVYPCGHCAEHMRAEMEVDPPQVQSRDALSLWMCSFHNKVNEILGKPLFDCSRVLERWRSGFGDCNK